MKFTRKQTWVMKIQRENKEWNTNNNRIATFCPNSECNEVATTPVNVNTAGFERVCED